MDQKTLENVIAWLRYRREEARNACQEDAAYTIDMMLNEAREAYYTGTSLPGSALDAD